MRTLLTRLRGVFGTAITWGVGWAGVYTLIQVIGSAFGHSLMGGPGVAALMGSILGFISGTAFAVILSITERRHTVDELSLKRVALWGAIGGSALFLLALPQVLGPGIPPARLVADYLIPIGVTVLLGAGSASGSVAIAKRSGAKLIQGEEGGAPKLGGG